MGEHDRLQVLEGLVPDLRPLRPVGIEEVDLDEHPGAQLAGGIRHVETGAYGTGVGVDPGAQVGDGSFEELAGKGVDLRFHLIAEMDAAQIALVDVDPDPHPAEIGESEQVALRRHHLAEGRVALDDGAGERRPQRVEGRRPVVVVEGVDLALAEAVEVESLLGRAQGGGGDPQLGLDHQHLLL